MTDLLEQARNRTWYHAMELGPGHVTEGIFDMRPHLPRYGLPERMEGMRALDIGTWDGFFAFEMERRGAEVVALDLDDERALDWPPRRRPATYVDQPRGDGFRLAAEILGSKVQRVVRSIYDATPAELGTFDVVFCGFVLVHLRDQLLALERIAALCRGTCILAEEYDRLTSLLPIPVSRYHADRDSAVVFWLPSARTWERMLWTAGFDQVRRHARLRVRSEQGFSVSQVVLHASGSATAPAS